MSKTYYKNRPVSPNPKFKSRFEGALYSISGAFLGTKEFNHSLTKGEEREKPIQNFFRETLPQNFEIRSGEVVDCFDKSSPQLDLMIYDKFKTIKFVGSKAVIIPAEGLIVSIEVKSKLNRAEIKAILKNAKKLRDLKPYKQKTIIKERESVKTEFKPRYFHCVFAYETDITHKDWGQAEFNRIVEVAEENDLDYKTIDRLYCVKKGILNIIADIGVNEKESEVRTLMYFFSHILNFAMRENNRRPPIPYELYAGRQSHGWKKLK